MTCSSLGGLVVVDAGERVVFRMLSGRPLLTLSAPMQLHVVAFSRRYRPELADLLGAPAESLSLVWDRDLNTRGIVAMVCIGQLTHTATTGSLATGIAITERWRHVPELECDHCYDRLSDADLRWGEDMFCGRYPGRCQSGWILTGDLEVPAPVPKACARCRLQLPDGTWLCFSCLRVEDLRALDDAGHSPGERQLRRLAVVQAAGDLTGGLYDPAWMRDEVRARVELLDEAFERLGGDA